MRPVAVRRRPATATARSVTVPAPTGGLDAVNSAAAIPPGKCMRLYNMVASENGLRCRLGSREHFTTLGTSAEVRTMIGYSGSAGSGTADRVFAITNLGIYDVTTSRQKWQPSTAYVIGDVVVNDDGKVYTCDQNGTSDSSGGPTGSGANIADGTARWDYTTTTKKLAFGTTTTDAGYGIAHAVVTAAGHFILYCDEVNGYHVYTESTDTWALIAQGGGATQIDGVNPANFAFVMSYKSRVWFVEKNTGNAWYLDAGSIYGTATKLDITRAAQFKSGGSLVGLWNWTRNGGDGMDDRLVAISRGGDIAIYEGMDPDLAETFQLSGVWHAGGLPKGRRIATSNGGDIAIITKMGLLSLSDLEASGGSRQYMTADIANLFNAAMLSKSSLHGWGVFLHPEDNAIVVTVPTTSGNETEQFVMQLHNKSWSQYRDLPIMSACVYNGKVYFGTADGRVLINDGYVDELLLVNDAYTAIQYSGLTAFTDMGNANLKQVQLIRPTLFCDGGSVSFDVEARYNYDLSELSTVSESVNPGGSTWDTATWDGAVWSGSYSATRTIEGATGVGTDVAIAWRGAASSRTVLVKFDVLLTQGGVL